MNQARDFKFGVQIDRQAYNLKCKTRSKGAWPTSCDLLLEFGDLLYISGIAIARDFKFSAQIHRHACNPKNAKVGHKGRGLRNVTYFYNFGTPSISLERVKLETSNLVCILIASPINQKCKSRSRGAWPT